MDELYYSYSMMLLNMHITGHLQILYSQLTVFWGETKENEIKTCEEYQTAQSRGKDVSVRHGSGMSEK